MARRKGRNGTATNLYLDRALKREAMKLAFSEHKSLSDIVAGELRKLIARRKKAAAMTTNTAQNEHASFVPKNGIRETPMRQSGNPA